MNKILFNEKNIIKHFAEGMESNIYYYLDGSNKVLIKLFKIAPNDEPTLDAPITTKNIINKMQKLEMIDELDEFNDEIDVYDLVCDKDGKIIGYTQEIGPISTLDSVTNRAKKIEILKQLRNKIEMFNKNDIYIGDFNPCNILITKDGKIKLCDLDNFKIDDLDFDVQSIVLKRFLDRCSNHNLCDNYGYNILCASILGNLYFPYTPDSIKEYGLPRILNTKENNKLLENLIYNKDYKKMYLVNNMKKF